MAYQVSHPKNQKLCVFCKGWGGDANMVFKSTQTGFQFDLHVLGKCMRIGNTNTSSQNNAAYCPKYSPSVEAERLL